MIKYPQALEDLIKSFQSLPSVGRKTAERYALYILNHMEEENINDFDVSFILSLSIFHKKRISMGFQYCIYQPIRICTHSLPFLLLQCIMYLCSCLWPVPSFMLRILFPLSYSRPSNLSPTTVIPLLLF